MSGACPGQVGARPRELRRGRGTRQRRVAERWWRAEGAGCQSDLGGCRSFSVVQSGGALLCLLVVKPLPKAQSSIVWLCHTSQKESEQGRGRRRWLGFGSGLTLSSWRGLSLLRRAAGGRGSPSGRSESAGPACCSRSSSDLQTSSYPRTFWRCTCCNGFLRSSRGTGTPRPVTAEREPGYRQ